MKSIIEGFQDIGFLQATEHAGPPVDKQIPAEMIVQRLRERRIAPPAITEAIMNISDERIQKSAAVKLLRIVIFAKSISVKGKVLKWFDIGKVEDTSTGAKIRVSSLIRTADLYNKVVDRKQSTLLKIEKKISEAKSKKKTPDIEKDELRFEDQQGTSNTRLDIFLDILDVIYLSLASERR